MGKIEVKFEEGERVPIEVVVIKKDFNGDEKDEGVDVASGEGEVCCKRRNL